MDGCILSQDSEILRHRTMKTRPETWLTAIAPDRADLVVAVESFFPWYWLADLWAHAQMPVVLGHARSMFALHGGTAPHDTLDAQHLDVLRRGGRLPQACVSPAERRATRDVLRRL